MDNTVTSINDAELDAIITELEQGWLAEKNKFDENAWLKICDELSQDASRGCGLSYEVFAERFSVAIGYRLSKLSEDHQNRAIEIAKQYGYATPEEIEESQEFLDDMGYCAHGIELGCCPAGCE